MGEVKRATVMHREELKPRIPPQTTAFKELHEIFSGIDHLYDWSMIVFEKEDMRLEFERSWEDAGEQIFDMRIHPFTHDAEGNRRGIDSFTLYSYGPLKVHSSSGLISALRPGHFPYQTEAEREIADQQTRLIVKFIKSKILPEEDPT